MNKINPSNLSRLFFNLWQSVSRRSERDRSELGHVMVHDGRMLLTFEGNLLTAAKDLQRKEKEPWYLTLVERAQTIVLYPTPGSTLKGMAALCEELVSCLVTINDLDPVIETLDSLNSDFEFLARAAQSSKLLLNIDSKIQVNDGGQKVSPFNESAIPAGETVERLNSMESDTNLKAMANRLGTHILKSMWLLVSHGLAVHLSKEFNIPGEQFERSLDSFAQERGLK